jgi:peptidoglycan hydrolase-like protein with peptidoglycan-binding domain
VSTSPLIKKLQDTLNRYAPAYSSLDVDGEYGPKTAAVVSHLPAARRARR